MANHGVRIQVTRLDTGEIFKTSEQAAAHLYMSKQTILHAYRDGKREVMGIPVAFEKVPSARKVRNLTTGEVFNSAKEAAEANGVDRSCVVYAINHNSRCKGCWWRYA